MVMKALRKDSILQIKHTLKRFVSILLMALLGVGFFAGIKATSPDMKYTLDKYFDEHNIFDIELLSTLGFSTKDVEAIEKMDGIKTILPTYSTDIAFKMEERTIVAKAYAYTEKPINEIALIEGRVPEQKAECVIEKKFATMANLQIGDNITAENLPEDSILTDTTFQVVGIIQSPLYISRERGSSKLGSGMVDCYLYIAEQSFDSQVYTECYLTIEGAKSCNTFEKKYDRLIEEKKDNLESIATLRKEERYQEILEEANSKIAENEQKLADAKQEAQNKIAEAKQKIQDGEKEIQSAQKMVRDNEAKAQKEFSNANQKIAEAEKTLQEKETLWNSNKPSILAQISDGEKGIEKIQEGIQKLEQSIQQLEKQYEGVTEEALLQQKEQQIKKLNTNKAELIKQQKELQTKLEVTKQTVSQTESQIAQGKADIESSKQELTRNKNKTYSQLNKAKSTITANKAELEEAKATLAEEENKANQEIAEAQQKLADAKEELNKIEKPTWYILDRESNTGYYGYKQDTQRIANIGKVFPIVFFIVATLISLTSMTRMVEEQRVQIGTLKALGYSKGKIAGKYILYASLATVIGAIIGMAIGFVLLPKIIFSMYQMMYTMPEIETQFNWYYAILGLAIASICIVGATIYACQKELKSTPAELMRPKAPKPGKRVLLEKIPFIWNHMNFTKKVTARNLFRYKKRFLMTIIGICGCTALILAGFGLKNSISSMIPLQYGEIYQYQIAASLKEITAEEKQAKELQIQQMENVTDTLKITMEAGSINHEGEEDVQVVVTEDNEKLQEFIKLRNRRKKEEITLNSQEIVITEKVAKLLNIQVGDTITLKNADNKTAQVVVGGITENYLYHYIYISSQQYEALYGEKPEENVILIKTEKLSEEAEEQLAKTILADDAKIAGINKTSTAMTLMDDTMRSLDSVVWVLIVSAGLLALVVLYNLSNVNISERIRELATIKVLGFYDKEVYDYVTKETVILTIIGILIGLAGGYFLNLFIIETCELDILMFNKVIEPISYLYAMLITGIFASLVNIATYFRLKKIDMIESLKSVE